MELKRVAVEMVSLTGARLSTELVSKFLDWGEVSGLPVLMRPNVGLMYRILHGAEIVKAASLLGETFVSALVVEDYSFPDPVPSPLRDGFETERQIQEGPIERLKRFQDVVRHCGSELKAAKFLGIPRSSLKNTLRLALLTEEVLTLIQLDKLSEGHGRAISYVDRSLQMYCANKALAEKLNVRQTEQMAKSIDVQSEPVGAWEIAAREVSTGLGHQLGGTCRISRGNGLSSGTIEVSLPDDWSNGEVLHLFGDFTHLKFERTKGCVRLKAIFESYQEIDQLLLKLSIANRVLR